MRPQRAATGECVRVSAEQQPGPFTERLRRMQRARDSALCVGLDVDPRRLPASLAPDRRGIERFIRGIVEATHDLVCAYKPNLAFFEALGEDGFPLLRDALAAMPRDVMT